MTDISIALGPVRGVRSKHPDYDKFAKKWKRCRDVMAGQDAVHAGGPDYLPRLKEQTNTDYASYVQRAIFYNASWRTVAGLNGMMFAKPPKQKTSSAIAKFIDNVDLQGSALDQFAQDICCDVLEVGRVGILVDHPPAIKGAGGSSPTVAEVQAAGLRPVMKSYDAETIINWKYTVINNATMLSQIVLKEQFEFPIGEGPTKDKISTEFAPVYEDRYRVLDLAIAFKYRVRVFRIDAQGNDQQVGSDLFPLMNGKPLDFIPFQFISPDGTEIDLDEPPLIDLIDLNLSHYMTTADYEHGLHFSGLPTPWVAGYTSPIQAQGKPPEKLYVGSQSAWIFPDPQAKCGYLQVTGDFKGLREALDAKKQEMATLGARMLSDTSIRQVETFGATAIKHVAENSILAAVAIAVSKGIQNALQWFQDWAGDTSKVQYDINRDFMPVQMDAPTLTALVAAMQGGVLSKEEVFNLLKRGDMIEQDTTFADHEATIEQTPPPAPPSNTRPGELGTMTPEEKVAHMAAQQKATQNNQMNGQQPKQ